jgi:hypothetical protein
LSESARRNAVYKRANPLRPSGGTPRRSLRMEKWCQEVADESLAAQGLVVDDKSRRKLAIGFADYFSLMKSVEMRRCAR